MPYCVGSNKFTKNSLFQLMIKNIFACYRIMCDTRFLIQSQPLNKEAQETAKKELRETPEQIQESVAKLKELLKGTLFFL